MIVPSLDVEAFDYVSAKLLPPPLTQCFFFPEGFRVKIFIFFLVCVWWKWNWKWCLVMLPVSWIFSKRESFKFTIHLVKLLWDFGLGRSCVQLFDGTWLRDCWWFALGFVLWLRIDSSSSSTLSRSILCLFSGISCVFATCVAVYNYKTTMFQSKRKKKA